MQKSHNSLLSCGLLFLLHAFTVGCSTPAYFGVPNQRFESPVVSGETLKGSVGIAYENPTFIVTVKDITTTPPMDSGSEITRDPIGLDASELDRISIDLRIGLFKSFEISSVGDMYHLKYQFLGSSRAQSKGNEWVGSITADLFSVDRETEITSGNDTYKYSLDGNGLGGSVIFGYRNARNIIYYVNVNYLDFEADTTVTQNSTRYNLKGDGDQLGALLGLRYEQSPAGFYATLEWSYSKTSWTGVDDKEWGSVGALIGAGW